MNLEIHQPAIEMSLGCVEFHSRGSGGSRFLDFLLFNRGLNHTVAELACGERKVEAYSLGLSFVW